MAYRALDLNEKTANVFVLGPSHHVYLETATLSSCDELATPLGNLTVNRDVIADLQRSDVFEQVSKTHEEAEHSLEMQYPFVKILIDQVSDTRTRNAGRSWPKIDRATGCHLVSKPAASNGSPDHDR